MLQTSLTSCQSNTDSSRISREDIKASNVPDISHWVGWDILEDKLTLLSEKRTTNYNTQIGFNSRQTKQTTPHSSRAGDFSSTQNILFTHRLILALQG